MRVAYVFKRDDRGGLKERLKPWKKRLNAFTKWIKKMKKKLSPKHSGVSHPGDNSSDDGSDSNNRTDDSQELPTRVKVRKTWFDLPPKKKRTNNNEPRQGTQRHVEPSSQPSGGEGGSINDNEEDGSTNSEEETDPHKKSLNNQGKSSVTNDEDQISQQLPAPSHPPHSSSGNVPAQAAGPAPSLQQVSLRREDLMSMTPSQSEYYTAITSADFPQEE